MAKTENVLSHEILGCALKVHRALGPGLLESAYQKCLEVEFRKAGFRFEQQKWLGLEYGDVIIPEVYRLDFIVEDLVLVEIKSVLRREPVFEAQVMAYLKLLDLRLGLLINFNVPRLQHGMKRIVRGLDSAEFPGSRLPSHSSPLRG